MNKNDFKIKIKKLNKIKLGDLFYNDKFLIGFSIVLSFIIWIVLAINGTESRPVVVSDIPVTINLSANAQEDGLRVFSGKDTKASVQITGSRLVVGQVTKSDIEIAANQAANTINSPGNYTLELTARKVGRLNNYDFYSGVSPAFVTVMVDRYREVEFNLEDGVKYKSDPEYFAATTNFSSPKIVVSGPETEISKVTKVVAEASVDGILTESKNVKAKVVMYDAYGEKIVSDNITMSATEVDANIPILVRKVMPIAVEFSNKPEGLDFSSDKISIEPSEIEIAGPADLFNTLKAVNLVKLDFSKINLSNYKFDLQIDLPVSCKNLSNTYSSDVKLDMSGIIRRYVKVYNFSFINVPENKVASCNTSSMTAEILGPRSQVDELSSSNLTAQIDLKGKEEFTGRTEMNAKIVVDGHNSCWAYGDYIANVVVTEK